jgi:hypothetical protein
MQLVVVEGVDHASVAPAVGAQTYAKGVEYARKRAVLHMEWDGEASVLEAVVRGSGGTCYETAVYFQPQAGAELAFAFGECSCPVGINCKHVVAVAVAATGATRNAAKTGRGQPAPAWEQTLSSLLAPAQPTQHQPADAAALAIELSLFIPPVRPDRRTGVSASPQLLARLVRPGRTGWWATG